MPMLVRERRGPDCCLPPYANRRVYKSLALPDGEQGDLRSGPRERSAQHAFGRARRGPLAIAASFPPEGGVKRVFDIDLEHCPHCGGPLKIIAAIVDSTVIARILTHLGLPARAPPRAAARAFDRFELA
jgi:hypothetical protein